jgi:hypothetical protein
VTYLRRSPLSYKDRFIFWIPFRLEETKSSRKENEEMCLGVALKWRANLRMSVCCPCIYTIRKSREHQLDGRTQAAISSFVKICPRIEEVRAS